MTTETRDRLNELIRAELTGRSVDEAIGHLLDEHWKAGALADMERFRRDDPDGYNAYLRAGRAMDEQAAADLEGVA